MNFLENLVLFFAFEKLPLFSVLFEISILVILSSPLPFPILSPLFRSSSPKKCELDLLLFDCFDSKNLSPLKNKLQKLQKLQKQGAQIILIASIIIIGKGSYRKVVKWLFWDILNSNMWYTARYQLDRILYWEKRIIFQKESGRAPVCWIKHEKKKVALDEMFAHGNLLTK